MPRLFGRDYTKQELLDRVGDISQIGGVRQVRMAGGRQEGVEAVEFRTGSGLMFTVVPGRGMDITLAEHNGRPLAWRSAAGETDAAYYDDAGLGWLRSFPGGLVTTCGLTYLGAPCEDEGEKLGLHGRISNTPAYAVWADGEWEGDEYRMWVMGKAREYFMWAANLVLQRKVSAVLGQSKLWIDDTVTNESPRTIPHMILYHINAGFPVLDAGVALVSPTKSAQPVNADAEAGAEQYYLNDPPTTGYVERCYYHEMAADKDGHVWAGLVNKGLPGGAPFGFYVKYALAELPKFTQWKMNATQEYVFGLEPANCWVGGRDKERERGTLQVLEPGETREYHLEIGVLASANEVAEFEAHVNAAKE